MTNHVPATLLVLFAGVCIICATLLSALSHPIPQDLFLLASTAIGAAGGVTVPKLVAGAPVVPPVDPPVVPPAA